MKTPDEIKKGLECCAQNKPYPCNECPYERTFEEDWSCKLHSDALALIQQLEIMAKPNEQIRWERDIAIDQLKQLGVEFGEKVEAQVPKWISVEERLPEDNVDVLVYAIGENENSVVAMTGYTHNMYGYNIEGWRAPWQYFFYEYKITHWMPLPERPKEG